MIEINRGLQDIQYGFRKHRNTDDIMFMFLNDALYALENQKVLVAVFLDVKAAFDTMVHRQILDGVLEAKIRGRLLAFSLSFLEDRDMKVIFGKAASSNLIHRKRGVPQGSVLGPIYYNISEFNIPIETGNVRGGIFADDNCLWAVGISVIEVESILQDSLNQISCWAMQADISFSVEKTKVMIYTRKTKINNPKLSLNSTLLDVVGEIKWLVRHFDRRLTFRTHINQTKAACIRRLNIMKMLSATSCGPKCDFLIEFYTKYIRPKLEYGSIAYQIASKTTHRKLECIQNSALRIAFRARKTTPVTFLISESGLEDLEVRRLISGLKHLKKISLTEKNHPLKSCLLRHGQLWLSTNKNNGRSTGINALREEGIEPKLSEMLHIGDLIPTPIWDYQSNEFLEDLETLEGLDLANSFKYLTEVSFTDYIDIYTDAYKNKNGVGAAFAVPSKSKVQKFKLDRNLTVFDAEVVALTKAANFASFSFTPGANVRICSDSKRAI